MVGAYVTHLARNYGCCVRQHLGLVLDEVQRGLRIRRLGDGLLSGGETSVGGALDVIGETRHVGVGGETERNEKMTHEAYVEGKASQMLATCWIRESVGSLVAKNESKTGYVLLVTVSQVEVGRRQGECAAKHITNWLVVGE